MTNSRADPPKTAATVTGVDEVSIVGRASLSTWAERLAPLDLEPIDRDGEAEVVVITGDLKWGIRFRELSIAIAARPASERSAPALGEGVFLAQAIQTSRLFSWCERTFFRTPYRFGAVELSCDPPRVVAKVGTTEVLSFTRSGAERPTETTTDRNWNAPIFLPERRFHASDDDRSRRYFVGRIEGEAQVSPFLEESDAFHIGGHAELPILEVLRASRYRPVEWVVRRAGTHAKTKTARRETAAAPDSAL